MYYSICYALENTKDSGSMPTEKEPMPRRRDMTSTVIRPDIFSAYTQKPDVLWFCKE
jgi:hypothetical protein